MAIALPPTVITEPVINRPNPVRWDGGGELPLHREIYIRVFPGDASYAVEIEYNTTGTGAGTSLVTLPPGVTMFVDRRPDDNNDYYYRTRHVGDGMTAGAWTAWSGTGVKPGEPIGGGDGNIPLAMFETPVLSALQPDAGVLYAGMLQDLETSPNAQIKLSGSYSITATNYIDMSATGNNKWIASTNFWIEADGDAVFAGTLQAAAGSFGIITAGILRGTDGEVRLDSGFSLTKSNYVDLAATGPSDFFIKHAGLELSGDGSLAKFKGQYITANQLALGPDATPTGTATVYTVHDRTDSADASIMAIDGSFTPQVNSIVQRAARFYPSININAKTGIDFRAVELWSDFATISGTGTLAAITALYINNPPLASGGATNNYGIYIESLTSGTWDYAIYTNAGLVQFGDLFITRTSTSGTYGAAIRIPHGTDPTPQDGDVWTKTTGFYVRVNGTTYELTSGGSGVGGSGTINYLTRWTAASTIGDAGITDNGSTITMLRNMSTAYNITFTTGTLYLTGSTNPAVYIGQGKYITANTATGNRLLVNDGPTPTDWAAYAWAQSAYGNMYFAIDGDNNSTTDVFSWRKNGYTLGTSTQIMELSEAGLLSLVVDGSGAGLAVGAGNDGRFYHDGTSTYIQNNTGTFYIWQAAANEIQMAIGGAVKLRLDGTKLFPHTADLLTLGSPSFTFADLYLTSGGVIYAGSTAVFTITTTSINISGQSVDFNGGGLTDPGEIVGTTTWTTSSWGRVGNIAGGDALGFWPAGTTTPAYYGLGATGDEGELYLFSTTATDASAAMNVFLRFKHSTDLIRSFAHFDFENTYTVRFLMASGTSPFTVSSTTVVTNLNADYLDGNHASAFALVSHSQAANTINAGDFNASTSWRFPANSMVEIERNTNNSEQTHLLLDGGANSPDFALKTGSDSGLHNGSEASITVYGIGTGGQDMRFYTANWGGGYFFGSAAQIGSPKNYARIDATGSFSTGGTAYGALYLYAVTDAQLGWGTGQANITLDAGGTSTIHGTTFATGGAITAAGNLAMSNYGISGVNHIQLNDPGYGEGIEWVGGNGWMISEAPNALTNAAGNIQFTDSGVRMFTMNTSGQFEVTVATGTAPFVVASTTLVSNLNAQYLNGNSSAAFATTARGLPSGGSIGQVLAKASGSDYDTNWTGLAASEVSSGTFPGTYTFAEDLTVASTGGSALLTVTNTAWAILRLTKSAATAFSFDVQNTGTYAGFYDQTNTRWLMQYTISSTSWGLYAGATQRIFISNGDPHVSVTGTLNATTLKQGGTAIGTPPFLSTTGTAADSDKLDGSHGAFYQNAGNLNAGTLLSARLSGSYTGITAISNLGTTSTGVYAGTLNASEAGLGYDMNQTGHEGISMHHNGTAGYITSVDAGLSWHNIYIKAADTYIQDGGTTVVLFSVGGSTIYSHLRPGTDSLYENGSSSLYWSKTYSDYYYLYSTTFYLYASNTAGLMRVQGTSGYVDIGTQDTSWGRLQTDRANFYINKPIYVDGGGVYSYNEDLVLARAASSTARITITSTYALLGSALASLYFNGATTVRIYYSGSALYYDDGSTNDARLASVKAITATATAPTGDYPYGTFHCIY